MADERLNATGLVNILTQLYKTKDSDSKVDKDTFQNAFEEANANGAGVSTKDLLAQIEADTGIALDDFSKNEQDAINQTLSALSDDKDSFESYQDLIDISQEYFDELDSSKVLGNLNYVISTKDNEVVAGVELKSDEVKASDKETKTKEKSTSDNSSYIKVEGKGHDYGDKGYAQLVTNGDDYKMQICLPDGTIVKTRELTEQEREDFGLPLLNERGELDDGKGKTTEADGSKSNGSNDSGSVDESTSPAEDTSVDGQESPTEAGVETVEVDGVEQETVGNTGLTEDALNASRETREKIASLYAQVSNDDANEGFFGKIGGFVKDLCNTKYSSKNINAAIKELEQKGDKVTEEDIQRVQEMIDIHNKKSGGAANKTGNVAAAVGGVAAGVGTVAGAIALGVVSAPVSVPAAIIGVTGAFLGGALSKILVKQADKATNEVKGDALNGQEMLKDGATGGAIGASAYGIIKGGIGKIAKGSWGLIKKAGGAIGSAVRGAVSKVGTVVSGSKTTKTVADAGKAATRAGVFSKVANAASKGVKAVGSFVGKIFKKAPKPSSAPTLPALAAGSAVKATFSEVDSQNI